MKPELCEWDPEFSRPAYRVGNIDFGCQNEATISVGVNGKWHLCDECADRPEFRRFRVRAPLRKGLGNEV